jgi:hypothetical protein
VIDDRLARWQAGFDDAFALVAGRFAQADSRRRARTYVLGFWQQLHERLLAELRAAGLLDLSAALVDSAHRRRADVHQAILSLACSVICPANSF